CVERLHLDRLGILRHRRDRGRERQRDRDERDLRACESVWRRRNHVFEGKKSRSVYAVEGVRSTTRVKASSRVVQAAFPRASCKALRTAVTQIASPNAQYFMSLQAQPPARMRETVVQCRSSIL